MDREPDADFTDYLHARWPRLVAALEAEGVAGDTARLAVAEVLLERRRGWSRLVREEHVDVHVWQAVRERAGLPVTSGAALPDLPATEPFDGPQDWLPRAAASLRAGRNRRRRLAVVTLAAAAAVLAALAWWDGRPDPPAVREEANPLPVVWWASGELHLREVVVELPDVDAFAAWGDGAVARLGSGETVRVDAGGGVHPIDETPDVLEPRPDPPPVLALGEYDVVVQSVPQPGGGWAHLIDSSRRDAGPNDEVRQSESGRRALVVCDASGSCSPPRTIVGADGSVRLR